MPRWLLPLLLLTTPACRGMILGKEQIPDEDVPTDTDVVDTLDTETPEHDTETPQADTEAPADDTDERPGPGDPAGDDSGLDPDDTVRTAPVLGGTGGLDTAVGWQRPPDDSGADPTAPDTHVGPVDSDEDPGDTDAPDPGDTDAPDPTDTDAPDPTDTDAPDPADTDAPDPADTDAPDPTDTDAPDPADTDTPGPGDTDTPDPTDTAEDPTDTDAPDPGDTDPADTDAPDPADTDAPDPADTDGPDTADTGWQDTVDSGWTDTAVDPGDTDTPDPMDTDGSGPADGPGPADTDAPDPTDTDAPDPADTDAPDPTDTGWQDTVDTGWADTEPDVDTDTPDPADTDAPDPADTDAPDPGDTDTPAPADTGWADTAVDPADTDAPDPTDTDGPVTTDTAQDTDAPDSALDTALDTDSLEPDTADTADACDSAAGQWWYPDVDGDGFGDPWAGVFACDPPVDHVADDNDCDDSDPLTNPLSPDVLNGVDDDCDGSVDEPDVAFVAAWQCISSSGRAGQTAIEAQYVEDFLADLDLGMVRIDGTPNGSVPAGTDLSDYSLVLYTKCGWRWEGFNQGDVDTLTDATAGGAATFLFGDDMAYQMATVVGGEGHVMLNATTDNGTSAHNSPMVFDTTSNHAAYIGPYGTPVDYAYAWDMDRSTASVPNAQVLATHGSFGTPVFLAWEAPASGRRQATLLSSVYNANHGSPGSLARVNAEIVFKNTVTWLLRLQSRLPPTP